MAASRHYFNRKLHSLLGVVPIGGFLMLHLFINHFILYGDDSYNQAAQFMSNLPLTIFFEIFFIWLPLLYHGIYGLYIALLTKNNPLTYSYFRNIMFVLQRITGVILIIFISWHMWETRVAAAFGVEVNTQMMADIFSNSWMVAFYIIGSVAASFHFANGMWSFCVTWGITIGPKAQRISTFVWMIVFVIIAIVFSLVALEFASYS